MEKSSQIEQVQKSLFERTQETQIHKGNPSKHKSRLAFCPHCRERSVALKWFGQGRRVEFCLNAGCSYVQELRIESDKWRNVRSVFERTKEGGGE